LQAKAEKTSTLMKYSNINLNFPAKIEFKWQVTLFLMFGESRMSSASGVVSWSDGKQFLGVRENGHEVV